MPAITHRGLDILEGIRNDPRINWTPDTFVGVRERAAEQEIGHEVRVCV